MLKVYEVMQENHEGYDRIFVKKNAINHSFECLNELSDELETNEFIRVI